VCFVCFVVYFFFGESVANNLNSYSNSTSIIRGQGTTGPSFRMRRIQFSAVAIQDFKPSSFVIVPPGTVTCSALGSSSLAAAVLSIAFSDPEEIEPLLTVQL
jgi:hypothetical protein